MGVEAATSGAVFAAYLDRVLLPELRRIRPDAVLVMDNLAAHKTERVRALLDGSGFAYRYLLPAYSPDLNPIEPVWAKVKGELRRAAAHAAGAAPGTRPGARQRHPAECSKVLPPPRPHSSQLTCGLL